MKSWIREYWDRTPDLKDWFDWGNYYDCFSAVFDSDHVDSYRANFGIEDDEDILFARDTSSFDSRNQGLVITNLGLNVIRNNSDGDSEYIGWHMFHYVKVDGDQLYFYDKDGECVSRLWKNFFFKNYSVDYRLTKLAKYLEKIARRVPEQFEIVELMDKEENSKALEKINHLLEDWDDGGLHYDKARCLLFLSPDGIKNQEVENEFNKALSLLSQGDPLITEILIGLAYINEENNMWRARNYYLLAMESPSETTDTVEIESMLSDLETESKEEMDHYIDHEYKSRKLLMPIDDSRIAGCVADGIDVFRMSNIPSCIKFPVGHPVSGELYIGHPFKPELYVPYETHEEAFFVDKVHELCYLLQCLGATEITIESLKGKDVRELYGDSLSVSADAGIKAFSGSGSYERNYSNDRGETSNTRRAMHLEFDPMRKPYVPESLVWYPESTEWQRLVQNRLNGNMLKYEERLSTKQTRIINSNEQEKVKASAKILWAKANVNVEKNTKSNFKESIETEWKVSVTFRSIREMDECEEQYTDDEYILNEKDMIFKTKDELSSSVKKYLEKIGVEYNQEKENILHYYELAKQGDAEAQYFIGRELHHGYLVNQSYAEAIKWFRKSADQGYARALFYLGYSYFNGHGVDKDYKKAIDLYEKAAKQGVDTAQNNLGYMYEHGFGVEQSYEEAVKWYRKAAEQGAAKSKQHLGECYENGNGVTKDYNKALELYKEALGVAIRDEEKEELKEKIDSLTAKMQGKAPVSITQSNDNEQEYIETLKEIIIEDGEITDRERRLLEKLRTKLGISEIRAKELELSLSNTTLTAEEQEYLDEYKSIAADGEITDKERKLLDKIRKMSGISEERAREIEKIVFPEKTKFDVIIKATGSKIFDVVKVVKTLTGLGLKETKELIDSVPKAIKEGVTKDEAESIKNQLIEVGADVYIK